jgi:hypothetical protein
LDRLGPGVGRTHDEAQQVERIDTRNPPHPKLAEIATCPKRLARVVLREHEPRQDEEKADRDVARADDAPKEPCGSTTTPSCFPTGGPAQAHLSFTYDA